MDSRTSTQASLLATKEREGQRRGRLYFPRWTGGEATLMCVEIVTTKPAEVLTRCQSRENRERERSQEERPDSSIVENQKRQQTGIRINEGYSTGTRRGKPGKGRITRAREERTLYVNAHRLHCKGTTKKERDSKEDLTRRHGRGYTLWGRAEAASARTRKRRASLSGPQGIRAKR